MGGQQYQTDADSGLMLLGHRYYDSSIGRFITQDPIQDGDNWYAHCGNNPLVRTDPKGLEDDDEHKTKGGHRKRKGRSRKGKHEEGDARRVRDQIGEKGDRNRYPKPKKAGDRRSLKPTRRNVPEPPIEIRVIGVVEPPIEIRVLPVVIKPIITVYPIAPVVPEPVVVDPVVLPEIPIPEFPLIPELLPFPL